MPIYAEAPSRLADAVASNAAGLRYVMSNADDILSPYLASKPPVEKLTASTMSGLITERPSCCPLLTRNGLYTSTLLIYTEFSSNAPPRTLYCDESSECVDTPACVCIMSSTAFPVADALRLTAMRSSLDSCSVPDVCLFFSTTTTSSSWLSLCICICSASLPFGFLSTLVFVLNPTIENLTTTLSAVAADREYSPLRLVKATFICESTVTVAISSALPSSSVTLPDSVNVCARRESTDAKSMSIENSSLFIL